MLLSQAALHFSISLLKDPTLSWKVNSDATTKSAKKPAMVWCHECNANTADPQRHLYKVRSFYSLFEETNYEISFCRVIVFLSTSPTLLFQVHASKLPLFKCPICDCVSSNEEYVEEHLKTIHDADLGLFSVVSQVLFSLQNA
jgi:hypothetical protein